MIRSLVLLGLVGGAFATGLYWTRPHGAPAPVLPTSLARPHEQTCSDDCEQNALVNRYPEAAMRACKARCKGEPGERPHEVPRSITVAPADHRLGLHPPTEQRIRRSAR